MLVYIFNMSRVTSHVPFLSPTVMIDFPPAQHRFLATLGDLWRLLGPLGVY